MSKVLIQFAHPLLERSRVQKKMLQYARQVSAVTINDLYELYPDFDVDIKREQSLLLQHDIIIFQHPLYWYSVPALIKQWFDLVLEHGWAYGSKGNMLAGKKLMNVISCGGSREAYKPSGRNRFTINQMLVPVQQTANLCHMEYLPPFVVYGTHRLTDADIEQHALQFGQVLSALCNDRIQAGELESVEILNDLCPIPETFNS
ncbi:MAG: NAD(P)H-dependent oxidoreductase [Chitinophagaceae bacterium]|jgi:glutathione-regulated potassium-efflux system ancillary protein KefG|nr:NAD(P)H-dependent oxidoreductase [Chitinophagaceae bacterium]